MATMTKRMVVAWRQRPQLQLDKRQRQNSQFQYFTTSKLVILLLVDFAGVVLVWRNRESVGYGDEARQNEEPLGDRAGCELRVSLVGATQQLVQVQSTAGLHILGQKGKDTYKRASCLTAGTLNGTIMMADRCFPLHRSARRMNESPVGWGCAIL